MRHPTHRHASPPRDVLGCSSALLGPSAGPVLLSAITPPGTAISHLNGASKLSLAVEGRTVGPCSSGHLSVSVRSVGICLHECSI